MDVALGRTYHCKYTTYRGDGAGRDSYIFDGNGGLIAPSGYVTKPPQIAAY